MSYLFKFLILLALAGYAGFMDYLDNPERYEFFSQVKTTIIQEEESFEDVILETGEDSFSYQEVIGDERLSFEYDVKQYLLNPETINIKAKITNHSDEDVYFYYDSCNGIKYLFQIKDSDLGINPFVLCYLTEPMSQRILANSTFEYEYPIHIEEDFDKIHIDFRFPELTKDNEYVKIIILQGKPTKIQKLKGRNPKIKSDVILE
ncbi:MAG: hypothetical protein AB8G11_05675 [Saprospiraceae bacterium]